MNQIPSRIDEIFQELKSEITWLHARWIIYRQLFGHSEKRIDLLNECASVFFYITQEVLLGEVLITITKLTDRARSMNQDNLSLGQLQSRIEAQGETQLAATLRSVLEKLNNKCHPFRLHRNKRLAHLDLITAMRSSLNPLPGISREMVEETLELVRDYMNTIERHYTQNETGYQHFIMSSDGDALVTMLKYGLRYDVLSSDQRISWEDWNEAEWKDA